MVSAGLRSHLDTGVRSASEHILEGVAQFLAVKDGGFFPAHGQMRATQLPEATCIPSNVVPSIFNPTTMSYESLSCLQISD